ncbi:43732_t:CDS:2 [Gigaspora margarita]|uniref:43732_t:CDS:1 n=1 Tax=Gigaspora margarita TaxID=4874 RepID=A0ABN7VDU4_GIGMA|nr:43732_t:CDS:2 [Gigaspora margarita]
MAVHPFSHTAALIFHRSKKFVLKLNRKYNSGNNSSNNNSSCGKVNKRNQQDHDPDYLYKRGEAYLFGRAGEPKDEKKAFDYFQRASKLNHTEARGVLGFCYEFGLGVEKDFKRAELHYIPAAESGNGLAQARLAFLRKYGRPCVRIDRAEAEMWQQKVKEQGIGCEIDFEGATHWLERAASSGCRRSCERLKTLLVKECLGQETSGNVYLTGYCAAAA